MTELRATLQIALEESLKHLENLDESPVAAAADLATLRARMTKELTDRRTAS